MNLVLIVIAPALLFTSLFVILKRILRKQVAVRIRTLKENEKKFRALVEFSSDWIWEVDVDGTYIYSSPQVEAILGYRPEEVVGKTPFDLMPREECGKTKDAFNNLIKKGQPLAALVNVALRKDGRRVVLETNGVPIFDGAGKIKGYRGIDRDITEREKVAERLRENERETTLMLHRMINAFVLFESVFDEKGDFVSYRFVYINRAYEKITGLKNNEVKGKTVHEVWPGTEPEWVKRYGEVAVTGIAQDFELYHDPTKKCYHCSVYRPWDTPERFCVIFEDITESREAEKKLRESEGKFRGIFSQAAVGMARVAPDGTWLEVNQKLCDIVGYSRNELLAKTFQDITHPDDLQIDLDYIQQLIAGDIKTYSMEKRYFKKQGDIVWINLTVSLVRDENDNPKYFISIIEEITEKWLAKEKLMINEKRYQKAQALGHVGNWEYDPVRGKFWASDESKRIYGFKPDAVDFAVNDVENCIPEREMVHQALVDLLENDIEYDLTFDIITDDEGIRKTIHSIAEVERDDLGNPIKITGVINDITERKKMEEQLRQSQKMDAVGQLVGGVAHDFNNMLAGIMGGADVLAMKLGGDRKLKKYIDLIIDSSMQAAEMVQKLLSFSRKEQTLKEVFDVHDSVNRVSGMLERSIDKRIEIELDLNADISTINADQTQIQSAILNLGINAKDAMAEGGKLMIRTKNVDFTKSIKQHDLKIIPGKYIEIDIEDTGVGMSDEIKSHVFEPFFTTKEVGKGTGLGLAIVYNTIKENQGFINLYSETGKGTVVKIYLPVLSGERPAAAEKHEEKIAYGSGCVLVVDDESVVRIMAGDMLRELGYDVLFAEDGNEAVALYREKQAGIDLVMLDVIMPKMNGRDAFYALNAIDPEVKVLISSGFAQDTNIAKLIEDGALGFIQKPYRRMELSKKLSEFLS